MLANTSEEQALPCLFECATYLCRHNSVPTLPVRGLLSTDACTAGLDLNGKPVAVFGLGDSVSYGEYFCDAMEEVYRWALECLALHCCS